MTHHRNRKKLTTDRRFIAPLALLLAAVMVLAACGRPAPSGETGATGGSSGSGLFGAGDAAETNGTGQDGNASAGEANATGTGAEAGEAGDASNSSANSTTGAANETAGASGGFFGSLLHGGRDAGNGAGEDPAAGGSEDDFSMELGIEDDRPYPTPEWDYPDHPIHVAPEDAPGLPLDRERLADFVGLWKLYSYEVEGSFGLTEEDGTEQYLEVLDNGRINTYREFYGEVEQNRGLQLLTWYGDGFRCEYEDVLGPHSIELMSVEEGGQVMNASETFTYEYGDTMVGNALVYHRVDDFAPDPSGRVRPLSAAELSDLRKLIPDTDYGFFLSNYAIPQEIDWHQVFYNGAGIGTELSDAAYAEYTRSEEIFTDYTAVRDIDVMRFVWDKTHTSYFDAVKPLDLKWYRTEDDTYIYQHGDTNWFELELEEGTFDGSTYTVTFWRPDYEGYNSMESARCRLVVDGEDVRYLSCSDSARDLPEALLSIDYYGTRAECESIGVDEFYSAYNANFDGGMTDYWAVLTARKDGVVYNVSQIDLSSPTERIFNSVSDLCIPGESRASGELKEGERIAVRVNLPWAKRTRLMASSGALYGSMWFGDDNSLYKQITDRRYLIGHDLLGEGRGTEPDSISHLVDFLRDGTFAYYGKDGHPVAALQVSDYARWDITILEEDSDGYIMPAVVTAYGDYDYDRDDTEMPLTWLTKLQRYDESDPFWQEDPRVKGFTGAYLGDYELQLVQLYDEQHLILTKRNSSPDLLGVLIPGAAGQKEFDFVRFNGVYPEEYN